MKRKNKVLLDAEDRLLRAVCRFVEYKGGLVIVAGPTGVQLCGKYRYRIVIDCMGNPPPKAKKD